MNATTTEQSRSTASTAARPSSQSDRDVPSRPSVQRRQPWLATTGRVIGGSVGGLLVILGAVALLRTGLPTTPEAFTAEHVEAGWLHHTTLLAILHLIFGASLLSTAAYALIDRRTMAAGIVATVLGVIVWIEPTALHDTFGIHRVHGLTYGLMGLATMLAGWLVARGTTVVRIER